MSRMQSRCKCEDRSEDQLKSCFYFKLHNLCLKISLRCENSSNASVLQVSYNDFIIIDYYGCGKASVYVQVTKLVFLMHI